MPTYHVLGLAPNETGGTNLYGAQTVLQMEWQRLHAKRHGLTITEWQPQTNTGARMLHLTQWMPWDIVKDADAPHVKMIECVCKGHGHYHKNGEIFGCVACDGTGQTTQQHLSKFAAWQLDVVKQGAPKYNPQTIDIIARVQAWNTVPAEMPQRTELYRYDSTKGWTYLTGQGESVWLEIKDTPEYARAYAQYHAQVEQWAAQAADEILK